MEVKELSKNQLTELKERYYIEKQEEKGEGVSYGELAIIDDLVTDEEIFEVYSETHFVNDDFFCTVGKE